MAALRGFGGALGRAGAFRLEGVSGCLLVEVFFFGGIYGTNGSELRNI